MPGVSKFNHLGNLITEAENGSLPLDRWPLSHTFLANDHFDILRRCEQLSLHGTRALVVGPKNSVWVRPLGQYYQEVHVWTGDEQETHGRPNFFDFVIIDDLVETHAGHLPTVAEWMNDGALLYSYSASPSSCLQILTDAQLDNESWAQLMYSKLSLLTVDEPSFLRNFPVRYLMEHNMDKTYEEMESVNDNLWTRLHRYSTTHFIRYFMARIEKKTEARSTEGWLGIVTLLADVFEDHPNIIRRIIHHVLFQKPAQLRGIHDFQDLQDYLRSLKVLQVGGGPEGTTYIHDRELTANPRFNEKYGISEVLFEKSRADERSIETRLRKDLTDRRSTESSHLNRYRPTRRVANQSIGTGYDETVSKVYWDSYSKECPNLLASVVEKLRKSTSGSNELFWELYRYLQDNLVNHPVVQPVNPMGIDQSQIDPGLVLHMGIGRCSQTAMVAARCFSIAGFEGRVTQLHRHVIAEVLFESSWRVVDVFSFKDGVFPKIQGEDRWATLSELKENPILVDRIPARGMFFEKGGPLFSSAVGRSYGYVDAGLPWEKQYLSHIYFGNNPGGPQKPPELKVQRLEDGQCLSVEILDSNGAEKLNFFFSKRPRDWQYDGRTPIVNYEPSGDLGGYLWTAEDSDHFQVELSEASPSLFLSVQSWNKYMLDDPGYYAWPHEIQVEL